MEHINAFALQVVQESVGLGVLLLVLVGLYRLIGRVLAIAELGVTKFLEDFTRIADGIADIAETIGDR